MLSHFNGLGRAKHLKSKLLIAQYWAVNPAHDMHPLSFIFIFLFFYISTYISLERARLVRKLGFERREGGGRGEEEKRTMFLGGLPRRPDKETAYKQLKTHLSIMGAVIAAIRVTPYILHYLTQEKEVLRLDL